MYQALDKTRNALGFSSRIFSRHVDLLTLPQDDHRIDQEQRAKHLLEGAISRVTDLGSQALERLGGSLGPNPEESMLKLQIQLSSGLHHLKVGLEELHPNPTRATRFFKASPEILQESKPL